MNNSRLIAYVLMLIIGIALTFACDSPSKRLRRERQAASYLAPAENTTDSAQVFVRKSWAIGRDVGGGNLLFMKDDVLYSVPLRKCYIVEAIDDTTHIGWNIKLPLIKSN